MVLGRPIKDHFSSSVVINEISSSKLNYTIEEKKNHSTKYQVQSRTTTPYWERKKKRQSSYVSSTGIVHTLNLSFFYVLVGVGLDFLWHGICILYERYYIFLRIFCNHLHSFWANEEHSLERLIIFPTSSSKY